MENLPRLAALIGTCTLFCVSTASLAGERTGMEALSGLDLFEETYGPSDSHCNLGFIGYGSPLTVTRVSSLYRDGGFVEADEFVAVNDQPVSNKADLHAALSTVAPDQKLSIVVVRDDEKVSIDARCNASTLVLTARRDALVGASEGRWQACLDATIVEEMSWGGPNSQSAGLRLWCHQSMQLRSRSPSDATAAISRLEAQLSYDYASLLLDELQYVADDLDPLRSALQETVVAFDRYANLRSQAGR